MLNSQLCDETEMDDGLRLRFPDNREKMNTVDLLAAGSGFSGLFRSLASLLKH